MADALGLSEALSIAMGSTRRRRSAHDPGRVLIDLAVMTADGGTSLSDLKVLRNQPELFGTVASDPTAWRVLDSIDDAGLAAINQARAEARSQAWALGSRPPQDFTVLDSTPRWSTRIPKSKKLHPTTNMASGFIRCCALSMALTTRWLESCVLAMLDPTQRRIT